MATIQDEIRARVDTLTSELTALVRQAALEAVRSALEGAPVPELRKAPVAPAPAPARAAVAARARPAKAAPAVRPAAAPAAKVAAPAPKKRRVMGKKRPAADLQRTAERLLEHIKANPGQVMEEISKALGIASKELALPARKLAKADKVTTTGSKNMTRYTAK